MLDFAKRSIKHLTGQFVNKGTVEWIGIREKRGSTLTVMTQVQAVAKEGLSGDHYKSQGGKRQVTLIQAEHIQAVTSMLAKDSIDPGLLRRNIVVSGINLISLKGKRFRIGKAVLEYSGECHPCSRMEENLGPGGYNAMRGHGGILARVFKSGLISVGDKLVPITEE